MYIFLYIEFMTWQKTTLHNDFFPLILNFSAYNILTRNPKIEHEPVQIDIPSGNAENGNGPSISSHGHESL